MVTSTAGERIRSARAGFARDATKPWRSIPEPNEALLSFLLFVLVAFVLLAVDGSIYLAFVGPTTLALVIPMAARNHGDDEPSSQCVRLRDRS